MPTKLPACVVGPVLMLTIVGCGSSHAALSHSTKTSAAVGVPSRTTPTSAGKSSPSSEKVPNVDIPVKLLVPREPISARYTCDRLNATPPITWGRVPAGTVEIDLFVTNLARDGTEYTDWAVAGLKPGLRKLAPGRLPAGAIVGRNSYGAPRYSVCPAKKTKSSYFVLVIPLPRRIPVRPGFEGQALSARAVRVASHEGQTSFEYQRS